ncbi:MAG: cytochrome ubiquinol oxidase subunit I [Chloroflexota bacterium]
MDEILLARLQFAATTVYHFFFVPLTLGLGLMVAIMQTRWVQTGDDVFKRMTKFWGKLFLINFAMGVVTGLVQEFQFGLNWSNYSRFVGDIFGAPLAVEALLAFFLESTFLGVWIFGWDRLSKRVHLAAIWLVALGAIVSAFWILVANSWMQQPLGYTVRNGRAEMTDFFALLTNPNLLTQFPHVLLGGICTAGFFVLGISAYRLWRRNGDQAFFTRSLRWGATWGLLGSLLIIPVGHAQTQHVIQSQPMKMAAAEALWETENPAGLSLFTWGDEVGRRDIVAFRVPAGLSLLAFGTVEGEVQGVRELQEQYVQQYGPGNYVPPVFISYWSFRAMVGTGFAMVFLAAVALALLWRRRLHGVPFLLPLLALSIALPYIGNTTGWVLTEVGRQPWLVFGLMTTPSGVSPTTSAGMVLFSLLAFTLLYGALMVADIYLIAKFSLGGDEPATAEEPSALGAL